MTELLTAAQMRAIEQAAIDSGEVTGLELMERAGRGVVEAIFEEWPELKQTSQRAVVLCGPGNNGGDGFVVARLLKEWGWEVEVFLYGDPEKLPPDARVNYERWRGMGDVMDFLAEIPPELCQISPDDDGILLDALFGTGLTRALAPIARQKLGLFQSLFPLCILRKVAVDVPSGLDSDSGIFLVDDEGCSVIPAPDLCVTFHKPRVGHYLTGGPVGSLRIKDIGLTETIGDLTTIDMHSAAQAIAKFTVAVREGQDLREVIDLEAEREAFDQITQSGGSSVLLIDRFDAFIDKGEFGPATHKYTHGHALTLSGGPGKGGAARLAARGALRIGAGLVTLGCPPAALQENAARLDAIMLKPVHDADALARILEDTRINALCLGPGLGTGEREAALVAAALESRGGPRPTVLDADALTLVAQDTDLFAALHKDCVLTPHAGEFARLFPDIAEKLNAPATKGPAYSKVDATREAAASAGCVVLFKGPDTVIADPSGRCAINSAHYDRAAPWLATAGSGDVLAGFIAGLLARGFASMQAAEAAAWLHVECAISFGPGLIAEDLPEELPKVFRSLGL